MFAAMTRILLLLCAAANRLASSAPVDGTPAAPSPLAEGWATCASHLSCADCYAASRTCHWCAKDGGACHARGALHGCLEGASCDAPREPPEESKSCAEHATCGTCAASSWECHWCAAEEACHAKGSLKGCATGTSCYSIDRCQRLEPERVGGGGTFSKASFEGVGPVATGTLGVLLALTLCCSTCCFAGATFVKSAVDDLVREPAELVEDGRLVGATPPTATP